LSVLRIEQVSKSYAKGPVLRGVSLSCAPGESVLVLGPNGSGKSTLLKIAAGLIEPDRGQVLLGDQPVRAGTAGARRRIGYLPDAADAFPDLTVAELTTLTAALKRVDPAPLHEWRDRLELGGCFGQRLRTLSFGQRKRAFLLSALIGEPWLLILDEPSNGLDPAGSALVATLARERRQAKQGTLIASNDAAFARNVDGTVHRIVEGALLPAGSRGASGDTLDYSHGEDE
jgi:ABC-type multidrug transport system ATPase subunit